MKENVDPVELLIGELKKLPGIGAKSAQRIAFHLIRRPPEAQSRTGGSDSGTARPVGLLLAVQ